MNHSNGEGTIVRRSDGRFAAAYFTATASGGRKRAWLYGQTRQEVSARLRARLKQRDDGVRHPDQRWTVGAYLDHWLETSVRPRCAPTTLTLYQAIVRNHLKPAIGLQRLDQLTVSGLQETFNEMQRGGASVRTLNAVRSALRAALSRAVKEELLVRNPAKLLDLPAWHRKRIVPWTSTESQAFMNSIRGHRLRPAFLLSLTYGMRRGEVLGLTWGCVDFDSRLLRVDRQLQRIDGKLLLRPVKTEAGHRTLPLVPEVEQALRELQPAVSGPDDLVFVGERGAPIDPKNFTAAFLRLSERAGLRRITLHHLRHTTATALKNLGMSARDAQAVLGHAHVLTTQQLYQHEDVSQQRDVLQQLGRSMYARGVVNGVVKTEKSGGQNRWETVLTSGGPGGTRTLDTLLKRCLDNNLYNTLTSVTQQVRVRIIEHECGRVVVNGVVKTPIARNDSEVAIGLLQACHLLSAVTPADLHESSGSRACST